MRDRGSGLEGGIRLSARRADLLALAVVLGIGAALRLVSLPTRGGWDRDQGVQLLTVHAFVHDGTVPLVGPAIVSLGASGLHHGALYYDLLAPAAWLSRTDPSVVVLTIVAAGLAAIAATWWLGRLIGGPLAGLIAGLLMAVSASEVWLSTFIWNPTLLPFGGGLAVAGAWWAWERRRPLGWPLAAVGLLVAMQAHILGALLLPPLVVLLVADVRRTHRPAAIRRLRRAIVLAIAILVIGYTQLIANELTTGFSETRALVAYLGGGGSPSDIGLLDRLLVAGIRILEWPLAGLLTDAPTVALIVTIAVLVALVWRLRRGTVRERRFLRWAALTLAWCWVVLGLMVPSLATVVQELPVDHYHAFLDPIVVVVLALGIAAAIERTRAVVKGAPAVRSVAVVGLAAVVVWNLANQPPLISPDGGWPAAQRAGARIVAAANGAPIAFIGLPAFKGPQAYEFPVVRAGASLETPAALPTGGLLVVLCEPAFETAIGRPCRGPAEDDAARASGRSTDLIVRFTAAPGRELSVYRVTR